MCLKGITLTEESQFQRYTLYDPIYKTVYKYKTIVMDKKSMVAEVESGRKHKCRDGKREFSKVTETLL